MKLEHKFALLMFGFAIGFLAVTQGYAYFNIRDNVLENARTSLQQQAQETAVRLEMLLRERVKMLSALAFTSPILEALAGRNAKSSGRGRQLADASDRASGILAADRTEDDGSDTISRYLRRLANSLPAGRGEVVLLDRHGALLAASEDSAVSAHGWESWWQCVYEMGLDGAVVEGHGVVRCAEGYVVAFAIPVVVDGVFAGVLGVRLDLRDALVAVLQEPSVTVDKAAELIRACDMLFEPERAAWEQRLVAVAVMPVFSAASAIGMAGSRGVSCGSWSGRRSGWVVRLALDRARLEASYQRQFVHGFMLATVYATLMVVAAALLGHAMLQPLSRLTKYAGLIGRGEFDASIDITRKDEAGVIGRVFNAMVVRLQEAIQARDRLAAEVERHVEIEDGLRAMSMTDELTGLYNRRGLFSLVDERIKQARRQGEELYLLYADIDGLKQVNDSLGHGQGDCLIKEAAMALRQTFRESDIVSRIGGDEFAVLAGEKRGSNAMAHAMDRLKEYLVDLNASAGRSYSLSISTGIVKCDLQTPFVLNAYISRSDAIMYLNKRQKP